MASETVVDEVRMNETATSKPKAVYSIYIHTTPERVWDALTKSEYTRKYFFNSEVESDWKPGSPYKSYIDGNVAVEGELIEVDPPKRLAMTWVTRYDPEAANDPPSRVTYEIEPAGDSTKLTMVHDGFETETATYRGVSGGWSFVLSNLKSVLETGESMQVPM